MRLEKLPTLGWVDFLFMLIDRKWEKFKSRKCEKQKAKVITENGQESYRIGKRTRFFKKYGGSL